MYNNYMIRLLDKKLMELKGRPHAFKIEYKAFKGSKLKYRYFSNTEELFEGYELLNKSWEFEIINIYYENEIISKKILHLILEIKKERL